MLSIELDLVAILKLNTMVSNISTNHAMLAFLEAKKFY